MQTLDARGGACRAPDLSARLGDYCFGDADESMCERVQEHLLECDACWIEVQQLERTIGVLRRDPALEPVDVTAEVVSAVRLSATQEETFGGHLRFVLMVSALHASIYAASVWTELVDAFDRFGRLAILLTPIAFTVVFLGSILLLWASCRSNRTRGRHGLVVSVAGLGAMLVVVMTGAALLLPHERTIAATLATRTAFAGYLKNALTYFVPVMVVYGLVPFSAIAGLERELSEGRASNVLALLTGDRQAFHPRGVWYVSPAVLGGLLVVIVLGSVIGVNYLLDHLITGAFSEWFTAALYLRVGLWWALATVGFGWYTRRVHDLKQMALLLTRLDRRT